LLLQFKAEELARQKAQDVAMAEELVRIQNEKEAARVADMNARAAKIQAKMARMAEVQKEADGRAAADAARAQAELEVTWFEFSPSWLAGLVGFWFGLTLADCSQRRNREKDEELRHREADRKAREAEAKLIIDAQLKQKAADKLRRKQCVGCRAGPPWGCDHGVTVAFCCLSGRNWIWHDNRRKLLLSRRPGMLKLRAKQRSIAHRSKQNSCGRWPSGMHACDLVTRQSA
jgi:hypothetical protein